MAVGEQAGPDLSSGPSFGSRLADLASVPLRLLAMACARLPLRWVQRLGRQLGLAWYYLVPIRRRVVRENIALALPQLHRAERSRIARGCFAHVATTALELLWLGDRPRREALEAVVATEGLENYESVRRSGRGTIAVTAHVGNWDLLACAVALSGIPLSIVTKQLSSRGIGALWMARRRAAGVRLIGARGSVREILAALRRGEVIGLVVDQRTPASEGGRPVELFARPAMTTPAPAILAARTGAAIVPVASSRRPDGTHVVRIEPELKPGPSVEATTEAINRRVESWVRRAPEQWLWHHRRWQT